jgi:hypothetical protein
VIQIYSGSRPKQAKESDETPQGVEETSGGVGQTLGGVGETAQFDAGAREAEGTFGVTPKSVDNLPEPDEKLPLLDQNKNKRF